jgi:hypothetical protein
MKVLAGIDKPDLIATNNHSHHDLIFVSKTLHRFKSKLPFDIQNQVGRIALELERAIDIGN